MPTARGGGGTVHNQLLSRENRLWEPISLDRLLDFSSNRAGTEIGGKEATEILTSGNEVVDVGGRVGGRIYDWCRAWQLPTAGYNRGLVESPPTEMRSLMPSSRRKPRAT
ncbi:hypothetical protein Aut01nite_13240 [Actinoplanes utahensis]|nr:hypothetical protein Aut01nite_13240 [Actinoplanes utahensis]